MYRQATVPEEIDVARQRYFTEPYRFIPPYRSSWWCRLAAPIVRPYLRSQAVARLHFRGLDELRASLKEGAGILLAANHCRYVDAAIMGEMGLHVPQFFHFLVSYHMFKQSAWQAWYINRLGGFSLLREGADHEAIRASSQILRDAGRPVVIFPEGTWFRQNDRLGPLQEGTALIARHASRTGTRPVVVHPVAIKYWALADPRPVLDTRLARLESGLSWKPQAHFDLVSRIGKLCRAYLGIKECEYLGEAQAGSQDDRAQALATAIIAREEKRYGEPEQPAHLLKRVRRLRIMLVRDLSHLAEPDGETRIRSALDALFLCENLLAHSEAYLRERPTAERLIEAVQRIEESLTDDSEDAVVPVGAVVEVGPALRVSEFPRPAPADRTNGDALMTALARAIQELLDGLNNQGPPADWSGVTPSTARQAVTAQ